MVGRLTPDDFAAILAEVVVEEGYPVNHREVAAIEAAVTLAPLLLDLWRAVLDTQGPAESVARSRERMDRVRSALAALEAAT